MGSSVSLRCRVIIIGNRISGKGKPKVVENLLKKDLSTVDGENSRNKGHPFI